MQSSLHWFSPFDAPAMFSIAIWPRLTRRTLLAMVAVAPTLRRASAQPSSGDMLAQIIALATDPDTMALDSAGVLRRVAFRGGTPQGREEATRAAWDLLEGALTFGHIELSRGPNGWRLDMLWLLFGLDDEIPLAPLRDAFTKHFGAPRGETMSAQSNTVLRWRGTDRSVRVMADVPGDGDLRVYGVRIGRL
jgi:hypothetical protein